MEKISVIGGGLGPFIAHYENVLIPYHLLKPVIWFPTWFFKPVL